MIPLQPALHKLRPSIRRLSILFATALVAYLVYSNAPISQLLASSCLNAPLRPETARLIFVGGHESSGTGLMRVMLDAHPLIRCGAEPMVTSTVLGIKNSLENKLRERAIKAGIYPDAYNEAAAYFILKIVEKMGPPAKFLCHKQPASFLHLAYLAKLFPKAKFVHMLRDGRGAIASTIRRGFNGKYKKEDPAGALKLWEVKVTKILRECQEVGPKRCLSIRYESLVMDPATESKKLFEFLEIPWDDAVLRHETMLAQLTNLNPYEPSTKQFIKKIHTDSIAKWSHPDSVLSEAFLRSVLRQNSLLRVLGYADLGNHPDYTKLDPTVPTVS